MNQTNWKPSKGNVLVKIEDFETQKEGFEAIQTVPERHGVVVGMGESFTQLGAPGYVIGSRVKVPITGGYYYKEGEEDYAVFKQSDILLHENTI